MDEDTRNLTYKCADVRTHMFLRAQLAADYSEKKTSAAAARIQHTLKRLISSGWSSSFMACYLTRYSYSWLAGWLLLEQVDWLLSLIHI